MAQIGVASFGVAPEDTVRISRPQLIWRVKPDTTMVKEVRMTLNDKPVTAAYDPEKHRAIGTLRAPLAPGVYDVRCELLGINGRTYTKLWTFTVARDARPNVAPPTPAVTSALGLVNQMRQKLGLPPYSLDADLCAAAKEYSHQLSAGQSSADSAKLIKQFCYPGQCLEAVGGGFRPVNAIVQEFFDAPYQRVLFLLPNPCEMGCGIENDQLQGTIFSLLFCLPETEETVLYPLDGQKDVPLSWHPASETSSNPLKVHGITGDDVRVGYPITFLMVNPYGGTLTDIKATLATDSGVAVPFYLNTPQNDKANLDKGVILIPKQPLQAGTTYSVSVTAQDEHEEPVMQSWKFTTVAAKVSSSVTKAAGMPKHTAPHATK